MTAKRYQSDNPMRVADDLIVGGTNGAMTRLPKGANSRLFGVASNGVLGYRQADGSDVATSSALSVASLTATGAVNAASLTATGAVNAASLGLSGGITAGARITSNPPGNDWAFVAGPSVNAFYSGSGQIRTDMSGTAFYAPNGGILLGAGITCAGANISGTTSLVTLNLSGNANGQGQFNTTYGSLAFYASSGAAYAQINGSLPHALYAPNGGCTLGTSLSAGGGVSAGGVIQSNYGANAFYAPSGYFQSDRQSGIAFYATGSNSGFYAPNGYISAATGTIGGNLTTGQLHISATTTYGGGNSSTCQGFFYITINGSGWKVPLFQ